MDTPTATPTLTANVIGYQEVEFMLDGRVIPIAVGFNADGSPQTARELAERQLRDPADCDHAGATWSSNLAMRCPRCGSAMFLPPRLLAYLPAATLAAMDLLWCAAGWPEWRGADWFILPEFWTVEQLYIFSHCGGIPVRHDRRQQFLDALLALAVDGEAAATTLQEIPCKPLI